MKRFVFIFFTCLLVWGCKISTPTPREGFVTVPGGRIWYKVVGTGNKTPLLVIHGGPGSNSCRNIPGYSLLADDRPVIFYDQLGSGNSERPTDTTLWQLPRFVQEVVALRQALGLKQLHILGSSWGGAVAVEYLLTQQTQGIKSAIFSGPLISTRRWMQDAKMLIAQLPVAVQDTIQKYESLKKYEAPAYKIATDAFYAQFMSRRTGAPAFTAQCDTVAGFNRQVYEYMWGPTEFTATGTLLHFDRENRLPELKMPVLFIAGRYDEARPETMYQFQNLVPGSQVTIIEDAGHAQVRDQPEKYTQAIRAFLKAVE